MSSIPDQTHPHYGSLTTAQIGALTGMSSGDKVYDSDEGLEKVFDGSNWTRTPQSDNIKFTSIGGQAVLLTNKTGANSVKGELVKADTANDDSVVLTAANDDECFGAFLDSGIADGQLAWVAVGGIVEVLLKDATASTRGNWVRTSDVAGRADATTGSPPGIPPHFQEVGHAIKNESAGSGVLARIVMHFN